MKPRKPSHQPSFKKPKKSYAILVEVERKVPPHPQVGEHLAAFFAALAKRSFVFLLARKLNERGKNQLRQLHKIVGQIGIQPATALLKETLQVQQRGGLMTLDGKRKRTLGGIFFFLVKQQHPELFPPATWRETNARKKAMKQRKSAEQANERQEVSA